jgi:hypothetical protein
VVVGTTTVASELQYARAFTVKVIAARHVR